MNWPPTAEEWELTQRKIGRLLARTARLEEEREEDADRISALEAEQLLYEPASLVRWIHAHCPRAGSPDAPRYRLPQLRKRKKWVTRPEAEQLVRDFGGESVDLPEPDELLRLVESDDEAAA